MTFVSLFVHLKTAYQSRRKIIESYTLLEMTPGNCIFTVAKKMIRQKECLKDPIFKA